MLSLDRLQALAMVDRHGSIAAAAEQLHLTPSGVSQKLAKLERETGHRLLEPRGRGVRLTHAGRVLAEHASRILTQCGAAEVDLADLTEEILGPLRIGAMPSTVRRLLAPALTTLRERYPRLWPTLRDGEVVDTMPLLLAGELDLVVAENWAHRPTAIPEGVSKRLLFDERVMVALPADHPLADRDTLDLAELAGAAWTSCGPGSAAGDALVQAVRNQGVEPEVRYTVTEFPTQAALVEAGLAVALIAPFALQSVPAGVRLVPPEPALRREIHAVWRTDRENPAVRAGVAALAGAVPSNT
ncbi:LysR family transcriptional regulator [Amycolatopsis aidingensis]|uniref:LysR family transcriptional regulator n=1 Tax=Amycolatopsis aidingensis TaxID=2842453 RepID=UPI001C0C3251|nr:LysR family transcriptional regulator [Amycolatopsis aidingensis]